jgi:hypothetical protein
LVGSALTLSATVGAAAVKQYILTEVAYPVVVNGKEFKDPAAPILNYEGSTYVPLAKLGDITGVNYKWNEAAKRVEIVTGSGSTIYTGAPAESGEVTTKIYDKSTGKLRDVEAILAEEEAIRKLAENTKVTVKSEVIEDQGNKVFHAYDVNGTFMGRFTDGDDVITTVTEFNDLFSDSTVQRLPAPKFSDGWISNNLVKHIFKYTITLDGSATVIKSADGKELARITLPADWASKTSGEATVNNIKLKK